MATPNPQSGSTIKYGRLDTGGRITLADLPALRPLPGEVVVKMAACGICGTDLEKVTGGYTASSKIGHEPVGRIDELGEGVEGLQKGDRVFVHHHVSCGSCETCAKENYTVCTEYSKTNLEPGGFAEKFKASATHVRAGAVLKLDNRVSWEEGTLLEPAGCVFSAARRVDFKPNSTVFIYGLGGVGLLWTRIARALGASWIGGAEISPLRQKAAHASGIDAVVDPRDEGSIERVVRAATAGRGVDLAVIATSHPSAAPASLEIVCKGGKVNSFAVPVKGSQLQIDHQRFYLSELSLISSYATTERDIVQAHDMLVNGRLVLKDLVSHRFPLREIEAAFDRAKRPDEALRVVVTGPAFDGE